MIEYFKSSRQLITVIEVLIALLLPHFPIKSVMALEQVPLSHYLKCERENHVLNPPDFFAWEENQREVNERAEERKKREDDEYKLSCCVNA